MTLELTAHGVVDVVSRIMEMQTMSENTKALVIKAVCDSWHPEK